MTYEFVLYFLIQYTHFSPFVYYSFVPVFLNTDIDECMNATTCHKDAYCNNTKGSFNCTCHPGYSGDGKNNCTGM